MFSSFFFFFFALNVLFQVFSYIYFTFSKALFCETITQILLQIFKCSLHLKYVYFLTEK